MFKFTIVLTTKIAEQISINYLYMFSKYFSLDIHIRNVSTLTKSITHFILLFL